MHAFLGYPLKYIDVLVYVCSVFNLISVLYVKLQSNIARCYMSLSQQGTINAADNNKN